MVMYLCVRGVSGHGVLGVSSVWSCICVLGVMYLSFRGIRRVNGHLFEC